MLDIKIILKACWSHAAAHATPMLDSLQPVCEARGASQGHDNCGTQGQNPAGRSTAQLWESQGTATLTYDSA